MQFTISRTSKRTHGPERQEKPCEGAYPISLMGHRGVMWHLWAIDINTLEDLLSLDSDLVIEDPAVPGWPKALELYDERRES